MPIFSRNMRLSIALVVIIAALTAPFGQSHALSKKAISIYTPNLPPYITKDLNVNEPFVMMIREILEPLGYQVALEYIPLPRALNRTQQALIPLRFPAWQMPIFSEDYYSSEPVLETEWSFFTHKDLNIDFSSSETDTTYSLVGLSLPIEEMSAKLPKMLRPVNSGHIHSEHLEQLIRGRADVWGAEKYLGRHLLATCHPEQVDNYRVSGTFQTVNIGMLASKANDQNLKIIEDFNKGLTALKTSGRYQELINMAIGNYLD
jgi:hypothetical protein